MTTEQATEIDETKKIEDLLERIPDKDLQPPTEKLRPTTPEHEFQIRRIQEKLGVSREIAEKMIEESGGQMPM